MLWLFAGLAIGILNGLALRWTITRLRPDAALTSTPLLAMGFLLRLGLTTTLLAVAFQRGVESSLLALAGLWLARWVTVAITLSPRPLAWPRRS